MDRNLINEFTQTALEKELRKVVAKGEITPTEVDNLTKSACLVEKLEKIESYEMMPGYDDESSARGGWMVTPYSSPMDRNSYRQGSYGNNPSSMNRMRNMSYSNTSGSDRLMREAERLLGEAHNENERQAIMGFMNNLQGM